MRWFLLIVIFIFLWGAMEVYCNTVLVRNSYAIQRLEDEIDRIERENGSLKRKISSHLSLREVEIYAREKLSLVEPQQVRYIQKELDGKKEKALSFGVKICSWIKELCNR